MYYVYILKLANGSLYTGRSNDLKRRISEHMRGKVKSTKHKLPAKIIYYEAYVQKDDAISRELFLKTGDGRQQIQRQLKSTLSQV